MPDPSRKPAIGRGLSALMGDIGVDVSDAATPPTADRSVPVELIHPNPDQPRRHFDEEELSNLASSIAEKGIIQPLIVRPRPGHDGEYEIVAGERRWRAAQRAGLHDVPVVQRELNDTEVLEVAIIENIQRADLNPVEEALGFRQLMDRFGHTQDQLSKALGKSRSHIANLLRLLNLPDPVLQLLRNGDLTAGHARALVGLDDAEAIAKRIVAKSLSVRDAERLAKSAKSDDTPSKSPRTAVGKDADTRALEGDLTAALGLSVSITHGRAGEGGHVSIRYRDLDQLDALCQLLSSGLGEKTT